MVNYYSEKSTLSIKPLCKLELFNFSNPKKAVRKTIDENK